MTRRTAPSNLPFEPRGLSREEAAAYVGIGARLFDRMVEDGKMPQPGRAYGRVIWDKRQIDLSLDRIFDVPVAEDRRWKVTAA